MSIRQQRDMLWQRRRRLIFNDDSNYKVELGNKWDDGTFSAGEFAEARLRHVLGTQIDTVFWNVGHNLVKWNTGLADFPVIEPYKSMIDEGLDPLKFVVDFCRSNSLEIFGSYRMNDCHDADLPDSVVPYKKAHPELLLGEKGRTFTKEERTYPSTSPQWIYRLAYNYALPEVRDHFFLSIQEVCENYDIDGLELDFLRAPMFFKSNYNGRPAKEEEMDAMTGFLGLVRKRIDQTGLKRGRPLLLAVHVPMTVQLCRCIGLDVEKWIKDGLVDILVLSAAYGNLANPVAPFVQLAHKYGVLVYPRITGAWAHLAGRGIPAWRAVGMVYWSQGVDGLYLFNFSITDDPEFLTIKPVLDEIGEPKMIANKDKVYGVEYGKLSAGVAHIGIPRELPLALEKTGGRSDQKLHLAVADDVERASSVGLFSALELDLHILGLKNTNDVSIRLNGHPLGDAVLSEDWLVYPLQAPPVKKGVNELEPVYKGNGSCVLDRVELWVRYKPA